MSPFERLARNPVIAGVVAVLLLVVLAATLTVVPETKQAVILRFGEPLWVVNSYKPNVDFGRTGAGLIARVPFVDQIVWIDKRIQSVEMERQQVLSIDQLRLNVDAYARYRIVDPLRMVISARSEQRVSDQLRPILGSALRNELGKRPFAALLSPEREGLMHNIRTGLDRVARQYGAEIIDVRIKRADLPEGTPLDSAYERMRSARQQEALSIRAEGRKQAQLITAQADADASKVYAASFGKDPDFYDFYRAMQSYRHTFGTDGQPGATGSSSIILSPDNAYLKEFRGR